MMLYLRIYLISFTEQAGLKVGWAKAGEPNENGLSEMQTSPDLFHLILYTCWHFFVRNSINLW